MNKAKTVASISFLDNHSICMDVEKVVGVSIGKPMELEAGQWFCELVVRSEHGNLSIQMLAAEPDRLVVETED